MKFDIFFKIFLSFLLTMLGSVLLQTFATIKSLEKDIITIREKIVQIESTRISRKDISEMIADYHNCHPCSIEKNRPD